MDSGNVVIDSEMAYPILFIPKKCTTLETNCELTDNVYIDVNITSPDTEGNDTSIYSGFCNIKLVDSYDVNLNQVESPDSSTGEPDLEQMPVILSDPNQYQPYNQSRVWIDPSRSPYVYNDYEPANQEQYSIRESAGLITVEQHNTYITQNVYNCKESNDLSHKEATQQSYVKDYEYKRYKKVQETVATAPMDTNMSYYEEDEFECGVYLSQPASRQRKTIMFLGHDSNSGQTIQNISYNDPFVTFNALKQLMSSDMQPASKQRKTIMFLGHDSNSGQTMQNISYNDPFVTFNALKQLMSSDMQPASKQRKTIMFLGHDSNSGQTIQNISYYDPFVTFNALKQLMSSDMQPASKQRKTIMFLGHDSNSGKTMQNISYNDPFVTCTEMEVDNEVVIGKFQRAETADVVGHAARVQAEEDHYVPRPRLQLRADHPEHILQLPIFDQISAFRLHMVGSHTTYSITAPPEPNLSFTCTDCGKNLKNQTKFEIHCMGHGDPDLECAKCRKVFASKFSLRIHMKIHKRKYQCSCCIRSFASLDELTAHLKKMHCKYMCQDENCSCIGGKTTNLNDHHIHKAEFNELEDVDDPEHVEGADLKPDVEDLIESSRLEKNQGIAGPSRDLSRSNENIAGLNEGPSKSNRDFVRSSLDLARSGEDLTPRVGDNEGERIRKADSVIAKVISNKIFLLSSKKASRGRCLCLKRFDRIDDLKRHLIEHVIRSTLAKTPVCQTEVFSKVDKYKAHLREHAKLTIYKCTFCDKSFSDSSNFSKHKKIHGVSYFQCDLCYRKFNSKKMITQHIDHHNKTTPVQCAYCHRTFHFQSMLNKHIRSMHKTQEGSKCHCRFCDVAFNSLKDKWNHEWEVHNVRSRIIDCLICGSQFRKYAELKRHCLNEHEMDIQPAKKMTKKRRMKR
ncbi:putative ZNF91L, partial [Operophtera brumata]